MSESMAARRETAFAGTGMDAVFKMATSSSNSVCTFLKKVEWILH